MIRTIHRMTQSHPMNIYLLLLYGQTSSPKPATSNLKPAIQSWPVRPKEATQSPSIHTDFFQSYGFLLVIRIHFVSLARMGPYEAKQVRMDGWATSNFKPETSKFKAIPMDVYALSPRNLKILHHPLK